MVADLLTASMAMSMRPEGMRYPEGKKAQLIYEAQFISDSKQNISSSTLLQRDKLRQNDLWPSQAGKLAYAHIQARFLVIAVYPQ